MKYRNSKIFLTLLLVLGGTKLYGQQQGIPEVKESITSNVHFFASNYGVFGLDVVNGKPGFTVPRNSDKTYLFGSGLWIGAKKQVTHDGGITYQEEKLSFIAYNPNSGASWATPGEYPTQSGSSNPILYHSTEYNPATGEPTDVGSGDPKWPMWLKPGEQTDPLFAGTFVPFNTNRKGDDNPYRKPAFMNGVDEEFFSRYHDGDLNRYEIGGSQAQQLGYPLGLQIQEHVYAWNPGTANENVVVLQYEVTNVSNSVLNDCYIAQAMDFDIGLAANDRMQFYDVLPGIRTGIAWSEQETVDYGTLAMVMLEGPITDANGFVDNSQRGLFQSQGDVGVFRNWVIDIDPRTPEERYDFMAAGTLDGDTGPGDKRALMGTKKFNMAPGAKAYFTFAFIVIPDLNPSSIVEVKGNAPQGGQLSELESTVQELQTQYYQTGFTASVAGIANSTAPTMGAMVVPNPATDNANLHLTLAETADLHIRILDHLGRTVSVENVGTIGAGSFSHRLNLDGIATGSYLVSIEAGAQRQSVNLTVVR